MLNKARMMSFVGVTDKDRATAFYGGVLGLPLLEYDGHALVFDANGTLLRVSSVEAVAVAKYTVLGWEVEDIRACVERLGERGLHPQRYDFVKDEQGVFGFPDGTLVAWYADPDGNILSLTQYANRPGGGTKPPEFRGVYSISGDVMGVPVKDFGPAIAYYTCVLGFRVESRTEERAVLQRDEAVIGLAKNGADPEQASYYFEVANLDALHEELTATGVEPTDMMPSTYDGRQQSIFFAKEPYGVCFCFGETRERS